TRHSSLVTRHSSLVTFRRYLPATRAPVRIHICGTKPAPRPSEPVWFTSVRARTAFPGRRHVRTLRLVPPVALVRLCPRAVRRAGRGAAAVPAGVGPRAARERAGRSGPGIPQGAGEPAA